MSGGVDFSEILKPSDLRISESTFSRRLSSIGTQNFHYSDRTYFSVSGVQPLMNPSTTSGVV
jgi:hypothetical protein